VAVNDGAVRPTFAERLRRARWLLLGGAVAVVAGIAIAGTVSRTWGGVVLVTGWLVLTGGIHAFGRSGEDR
jgi:hypothetical protein